MADRLCHFLFLGDRHCFGLYFALIREGNLSLGLAPVWRSSDDVSIDNVVKVFFTVCFSIFFVLRLLGTVRDGSRCWPSEYCG